MNCFRKDLKFFKCTECVIDIIHYTKQGNNFCEKFSSNKVLGPKIQQYNSAILFLAKGSFLPKSSSFHHLIDGIN